MKVGIVAGESSGDIIGARLIKALKANYKNISFYGLAGPKMIAEGCVPIVEISNANVMGFGHVIKKLPKIYSIKKQLLNNFRNDIPDLFIGIDFTDFNLDLAKDLKKLGVKIVQYKGPSVWAWRPGRKKKVAKIVDLLLTIFPFEQEAYKDVPINAKYVGHPIAGEIPLVIDKAGALKNLGFSSDDRIVAVLPGSRDQEIMTLSEIYLNTLVRLSKIYPDLIFACAHLNDHTMQKFKGIQDKMSLDINIKHFINKTRLVLEASDAVLATSGTVTFEAMLYKKPMIVAYKVSWLLGKILRQLISINHMALPNLLADKEIVREYKQLEVNAKDLSEGLVRALEDRDYQREINTVFMEIHQKLLMDTEKEIVKNISDLLVR